MQKLYCYIDESGRHREEETFIVSVVITEEEREELRERLEEIEKDSGKGRVSWVGAKDKARVAYIKRVLATPAFKGKLNYATYHPSTEHLANTVLTTARAISIYVRGKYKATIFVDGLPKSQTRWFGSELRHLRIRTQKVRGIRKEEADALMRLADAVAGFARAAISGREELARLLEKAKKESYIKEL